MNAGASTGEERYLDVRYSEATRPFTDYPSRLTRYLAERHLAHLSGGALLDLGSGRGEFLHGFGELGFRAQGIDRARPTSTRFPEPVVQADYERDGLPFADGSFDVLFNKSVFEHITDIGKVLRECLRVIRPGGRMISLVPDWQAQWRHFYDDWTHVRPFTLTGLRECVQSHGFEVREAARFRQLPWLWERPYLQPIASLAALLPVPLKRFKVVRFSKEWMLLVVADRPV
ncbi:MAG TPA: class I SAM-dependent methyltransferase [Polyangiaceae bacterium]|nr:class I SAM-dependent methyltransferase [Polyangiaceae bacterium]